MVTSSIVKSFYSRLQLTIQYNSSKLFNFQLIDRALFSFAKKSKNYRTRNLEIANETYLIVIFDRKYIEIQEWEIAANNLSFVH